MRLVGHQEPARPQKRRVNRGQTQTFRARLFELGPPDRLSPAGRFTELWDTLEEPFEENGKWPMPPGKVVAEEITHFEHGLRERMDAHRRRLGIVSCGNWRWGRECGGA